MIIMNISMSGDVFNDVSNEVSRYVPGYGKLILHSRSNYTAEGLAPARYRMIIVSIMHSATVRNLIGAGELAGGLPGRCGGLSPLKMMRASFSWLLQRIVHQYES